MPPVAKKDCCVIVYDANCGCKQEAIEALMKIAMLHNLSNSKDSVQLIVANTKTSRNDYGYEHIDESDTVHSYNPAQLLHHIEQAEPAEGNWLEGLLAGLHCLESKHTTEKNIVTMQLLYITDLTTQTPPSADNSKLVKRIVNLINAHEIFLYILGPEIQPATPVSCTEDVQRWMKNVTMPKDNANFSIAKDIIDQTTHSLIASFQVGIHLFMSYRNPRGTQPWTVPLTFGTKLEIAATTLRILKQEPLLKLKAAKQEGTAFNWVDVEDVTQTVDDKDVRSGVSRHDKFVEIQDEKMFKGDDQRCFSILGFTDVANIPEYLMQGEGTYFVIENGDKPNHDEIFSMLVECLAKQQKYAIAKRVYMNCATPKYVVLVPQIDMTPKTFILVDLPYADDVCFQYNETKALESVAKGEIKQDVVDFLDKINVDSPKCQINVPLGPSMMVDINSCIIADKAIEKCLERNSKSTMDTAEMASQLNEAPGKVKDVWVKREIKTEKTAEDAAAGDTSDSDFD